MRQSLSIIISTALVVVLLGCPRRVGSQSELDPTSREKVAQAKQRVEAGAPDEALKLLQGVPEDNEAVAEVVFQVAEAQFAAKDYAGARSNYRDLLARFPLFEQADRAGLRLAYAQMELKECRDALQTLVSLYSKLEEAKRLEVASQAASAAECAGDWSEAARWYVELMQLSHNETQQKAAQQRVNDLLESRASFPVIAKLAQQLPTSSPQWPLVQFKLAKIYAHTRDSANLKDALDKLLEKAPTCPWAGEARAMLDRAQRRVVIKPDTIGIALPLSGRFKSYGESVMAGIQLALKDSSVKYVVRDTAGDSAQARAAIAALAQDEQVIAIIGPILSGESADAAAEAELQETPLVTLTRAEGITDTGSYIFRNMLTNSAQARALVDWAMRVRGLKKFAVLYPNIPYGTELTTFFQDEVKAHNGIVSGVQKYESDQTTFSSVLKNLVGHAYAPPDKSSRRHKRATGKAIVNFEALFIPDYYKTVGLVAPALAVEDVMTNTCEKTRRGTATVQLLGANGWNFNELLERGGKYVECAVFVDGFFAGSEREETKLFVEEFRKANHDKDPALLEAESYDTARILRSIVEKQKPITRAALRDALLRVKDFPGATGSTTFNAKREAEKTLFILTIDQGEIRELNNEPQS